LEGKNEDFESASLDFTDKVTVNGPGKEFSALQEVAAILRCRE
jgi:hypothetical protein